MPLVGVVAIPAWAACLLLALSCLWIAWDVLRGRRISELAEQAADDADKALRRIDALAEEMYPSGHSGGRHAAKNTGVTKRVD